MKSSMGHKQHMVMAIVFTVEPLYQTPLHVHDDVNAYITIQIHLPVYYLQYTHTHTHNLPIHVHAYTSALTGHFHLFQMSHLCTYIAIIVTSQFRTDPKKYLITHVVKLSRPILLLWIAVYSKHTR